MYQQALQDRFVMGVRLNKFDEIKDDFNTLQAQSNVPAYLEEAFGDYWAAKGSPHKALEIYQEIEQQALTNKLAVSDGLLHKLSLTASDAGKFALAQQYLERMNSNVYINDYTRTSKILNPGYDSRYFGLARLALWRGNSKLAQQLIDDRLFNKTLVIHGLCCKKQNLSEIVVTTMMQNYGRKKAGYF